ncbi:MAG: hypothetical protein ACRC9Q_08015, partial [Bacteroidales bacterium]
MTKKSPLFVSGLIAASIFLSSCETNQKTLIENEIKFDTLSLTDSVQLNIDTIRAKCKVNLTILFPVSCGSDYEIKEIERLFLNAIAPREPIFETPDMALQFYRDSCYSDFNAQIADLVKNIPDFKEEPPSFITGFFHQKDITVPFNKENILTIKASIYD